MKPPRSLGAGWAALNSQISACERCPRLIAHCRQVAQERRRAYRDETYWGRPVPNFGDAAARLLIVGLAPAAHGSNRTGRMFTGDRSGDWLYRALYRAGFANRESAVSAADGLRLKDCAITAVCHCAPPDNKPTREEEAHCQGWLAQTVDLVDARVYLALGQIAWRGILGELARREALPRPRPRFGHGACSPLAGGRFLVGAYHPSQQNTFTGRLTEGMLDEVFALVRRLLAGESPPGAGRRADPFTKRGEG